MKLRYLLSIGIGIIMLSTSWALAENDAGRDLDKILDSNKVVIAMVDRDYPPFIVQAKDGQLAGWEVDLAKDVASELGVTLEIAKAVHFNDIIEMVESGKADIGLSNLSVTCSRAKNIKFTNTYRELGIILLLNRMKVAALKLPEGMKDMRELYNTTEAIGVIERSAYEAAALKHFPQAKVQTYNTYKEMIAAVDQGEVLLAVGNSGTVNAFLKDNQHLNITLQAYQVDGFSDHIAMAVGVDNDHLLAWLNAYLTVRGPHFK
jgi:ABC-type amino acid transport substrate-binding protein